MASNVIPICVDVNDVQLLALSKLLHGQPIDTGERCELLALHIHMGAQVVEYREDLARLMRGMGADALREATDRVSV